MQKSEPPAEDGATHDPVPGSAREAVERLAGESRGRLLALLAAAVRDLALAEDGLADAFERALRTWPETGVPQRPEAWLMTVARNRIRDHLGSAAARSSVPMDAKVADVQSEDSTARLDAVDVERIPDKRLELLFACAHPAIAETMRTPLMLQVVFGCDAAEVARLYGVPTATMAQRLVRTKRRIRDAGIPFHIPTREDMLARLAAVLEAIYGAYASDWLDQRDAVRESLADEARWLAVLVAELLGDEPEAWGLAALLTFAQSRAPARASDPWPPIQEQDTALWDPRLIRQAEAFLHRAHRLGAPLGRFQLEAAIQSVHGDRKRTGRLDRARLLQLYDGLIAVAPTHGAVAARAAVLAAEK
ncbi:MULTISPECIES: RNA polymerase sigma factor [Actinomycetes]|uniref:RNA polymerase sigma factor n=1 Tax=Actinomycetes TaxID=1760 RepID=UPI0031D569EF